MTEERYGEDEVDEGGAPLHGAVHRNVHSLNQGSIGKKSIFLGVGTKGQIQSVQLLNDGQMSELWFISS